MHILLISPKYANPFETSRSDNPEVRSPSHFGRGGLGLHVGRLSLALADAGHRVTVLAYVPGQNDIIEDRGVTVCRFSLPEIGDAVDPADGPSLAALLSLSLRVFDELQIRRPGPPDVIHCHHHVAFPIAVTLRDRFHAPIVSTFHYFLSDGAAGQGEWDRDFARLGEREVWKGSDHLIAVSAWLRRSIVDCFGGESHPITVVHHGTELIRSDDPRLRNELQESELGFSDAPVATFIGRFTQEKGLRFFLEAARIVMKAMPHVHFAIAGGTRATCADLDIEGTGNGLLEHPNIHFLGWLDSWQVLSLRAASSIIVVPSLYESFGYTAIEAFAAGVPVVASAVGGLPEIVEDGVSGYLVPTTQMNGAPSLDPHELAAKELLLLGNSELRRSFGDAARLRAGEWFSTSRMVASTIDVYRATLTARRCSS